jgi:Cof subfamily protein (haloacid dehalogenase superfamily)
LDLDNTVVGDDFQIPEPVRRAVDQAQAVGHVVTLATGRAIRTTLPFAAALGLDGPLICYQGARIQHAGSGELIFHHPVPGALAADVIRIVSEAGIHIHAYINDELYVEVERPEVQMYTRLSPVPLPVHVVRDLQGLVSEQPPTKIVFVASEDAVATWIERLRMHFGDQLSIMRSYPIFGEVVAPGCSKGTALALLAERLHIPREATIAIGDQDNDLPMIAWAGLGLAVANATPAVLAAADAIVPSVWEAGVAVAIERYLLGTEQHR